MAVRDKKRTMDKTGDLLKDLSSKSITVKTGESGKQSVYFDKTIDSNSRTKTSVRHEADVVNSSVDLKDGTYFSADDIISIMNEKLRNSDAKKLIFKLSGTNSKVESFKIQKGKPISESNLQKLNEFFAKQERIVLPGQASLTVGDEMGIDNIVDKYKNGTMVKKRNNAVIENSDEIKSEFLNEGTDTSRYMLLTGMDVEEAKTFPNTKFGIFARTIGNMAKKNAVTLGCAGAAVATMATHGTAIGTSVIGAISSGALWAGLGTFAAGAAPIAAVAVGAGMLINKVCKEYTKSKAEVESSCEA